MSRSSRYVYRENAAGQPVSEASIHAKACERKKHFATWKQAEVAARRMNQKYGSSDPLGEHYIVDRCKCCGRYWVGAESYHESRRGLKKKR